MKKMTLIFLVSILQYPKIIKLDGYYSGEGVIFDVNTKYPFVDSNYKTPYTPTINDIKEAESVLFKNYYEYETSFLDSLNLDKTKIKEKYRNPTNVKTKFFNHNRQYIGFVDKSNDTIVYIGLLNFSNKKLANRYFEGWKEYVFFGFDGFYEKNQTNYKYNLSKGKLINK